MEAKTGRIRGERVHQVDRHCGVKERPWRLIEISCFSREEKKSPWHKEPGKSIKKLCPITRPSLSLGHKHRHFKFRKTQMFNKNLKNRVEFHYLNSYMLHYSQILILDNIFSSKRILFENSSADNWYCPILSPKKLINFAIFAVVDQIKSLLRGFIIFPSF